ncbi:ubiquitin carboxyl-terminal hydrolase 5-like, partial [Phasianus colchicus]|uniref:ubiquitin carboxyl-terminal hydrolase 5-like n=1 Tax=Phasianus colchicus TaxID=9054 RepID=UPI00129D25E6
MSLETPGCSLLVPWGDPKVLTPVVGCHGGPLGAPFGAIGDPYGCSPSSPQLRAGGGNLRLLPLVPMLGLLAPMGADPPFPTPCSQQDAQEFLKFFMDRLHAEINRKGRRTPSILSDTRRAPHPEDTETMSDDERANLMWKRYLEREDSKIVDLFVGQLKSCL